MSNEKQTNQITPIQHVISKLSDKKFDRDLFEMSGGKLNLPHFKKAVIAELKQNVLLNKNACTPSSIFQAIAKAASLNLFPGGGFGLVYFVPYKDTCTCILGYQGMVELAYRAGILIGAQLIYNTDTEGKGIIDERGTNPKFIHIPTPLTEPLGKLIGVYSEARELHGKFIDFDTMRLEELEKIKKSSQGYKYAETTTGKKDSIWHLHTEEMYKKTVLRHHFKKLPKFITDNMNLASLEDDAIIIDEEGIKQHVSPSTDIKTVDEPVDTIHDMLEEVQNS